MALWDVQSSPSASHSFTVITPIEVLDYFDGPLVFTFRDNQNALLMASLCAIGFGASRYLVRETNDNTVSDLKSGLITLYSTVVGPRLWLVDVKPDGQVVNVWDTAVEDLPTEVIPERNALLTSDLEDAQANDEKLARFAKSGSDGEITFNGSPVSRHTIDADFYGNFCQIASHMFAQICAAMHLAPPSLQLGMTSESSYAVDLTIAQRETLDKNSDLWSTDRKSLGSDDPTRFRQAFNLLMSMIVDDTPSNDAILLVKLWPEIRQSYGSILDLVSQSGAEVAVRTRSNPRKRELSRRRAAERLKAVRDLGYPFMFLTVRGRLIGGLVEKAGKTDRNFVIRVHDGDGTQDFRGDVSDSAAGELHAVKLGDEVSAKLQIAASEKQQSYTLINIWPADDGVKHSVS